MINGCDQTFAKTVINMSKQEQKYYNVKSDQRNINYNRELTFPL